MFSKYKNSWIITGFVKTTSALRSSAYILLRRDFALLPEENCTEPTKNLSYHDMNNNPSFPHRTEFPSGREVGAAGGVVIPATAGIYCIKLVHYSRQRMFLHHYCIKQLSSRGDGNQNNPVIPTPSFHDSSSVLSSRGTDRGTQVNQI